jgi:hypothetical protein
VICREQECVRELLATSVMFTMRMSRKAVVTEPLDMQQFEQVALLLADGHVERHIVCVTVCKQGIATSHFHEVGYYVKANPSIYYIPSTS